jgi:hypothetical protein
MRWLKISLFSIFTKTSQCFRRNNLLPAKPNLHDISEDRPLTQQESELVRWLLIHGKENAKEYLSQVERLRVVRRCACGCASVDFGMEGIEPNLHSGMEILSDYYWRTSSGNLCGVYVFAREKKLAGIDLWSIDGQETPSFLPEISDLYAIETK